MKLSRKAKAFFAVLLLVLLGIYYYVAASAHDIYISMPELDRDYSKLVGGRIHFNGAVVSGSSSSFSMAAEYSDGVTAKKKTFTIVQREGSAPGESVAAGDVVDVVGVLGEDYKVLPTKMIIYKQQNYRFLFIRSIFGPLFLLFMLFRSWRFDFREKRFVER